MSANLDAIKARIRALQARTTARGCTEAEADTAAAAVARLLAEHRLSEADVAVDRLPVKLTVAKDLRDRLVWPVARLCRCRAYLSVGLERDAVYVGRAPYPELAVWLHGVVFGAATRAARDYMTRGEGKRRRSARTKAMAREAFLDGFVSRLVGRLVELQPAQADVAADYRLADQAMAGMDLKPAREKSLSKGAAKLDGAMAAGRREAGQVNLGWGINGPAAKRQITGGGS